MLMLFYECTYDVTSLCLFPPTQSAVSEDVSAFVLLRFVAVEIWRVKELLVPGIVASTLNPIREWVISIYMYVMMFNILLNVTC